MKAEPRGSISIIKQEASCYARREGAQDPCRQGLRWWKAYGVHWIAIMEAISNPIYLGSCDITISFSETNAH